MKNITYWIDSNNMEHLTKKDFDFVKKIESKFDAENTLEKYTFEYYNELAELLNCYNPSWDLETCNEIAKKVVEC